MSMPPKAEVSYPAAMQQERTRWLRPSALITRASPSLSLDHAPEGAAQHLDCSRTYIGKLEAEGVLQRQGGGFPLDQSRVAYLRYLRRERRQSPRGGVLPASRTVPAVGYVGALRKPCSCTM